MLQCVVPEERRVGEGRGGGFPKRALRVVLRGFQNERGRAGWRWLAVRLISALKR